MHCLENLDSFNRLVKEAIEIINGVELYHFNGLNKFIFKIITQMKS